MPVRIRKVHCLNLDGERICGSKLPGPPDTIYAIRTTCVGCILAMHPAVRAWLADVGFVRNQTAVWPLQDYIVQWHRAERAFIKTSDSSFDQFFGQWMANYAG